MTETEYGDDVSAYVTSYVWIASRAQTTRDRTVAADFRRECVREGGVSVAEWNAACEGLSNYSHRQGQDVRSHEFIEAKFIVRWLLVEQTGNDVRGHRPTHSRAHRCVSVHGSEDEAWSVAANIDPEGARLLAVVEYVPDTEGGVNGESQA